MATDRQIEANRRNALLSTGPRTTSGLNRSSQNAVTHGLTATQIMLPGEDIEEFKALCSAMMETLDAQGALEVLLVERAASLIWRMKRLQVFEVALFKWQSHQADLLDSDDDCDQLERGGAGLGSGSDLNNQKSIGRMIARVLQLDLTGKFTRYEVAMQKSLTVTL